MLDLTHTTDVEITLITNRLPWLGHVALMPDERSIKALLYGEESSRRVGRPFLRFKGILNDIYRSVMVNFSVLFDSNSPMVIIS